MSDITSQNRLWIVLSALCLTVVLGSTVAATAAAAGGPEGAPTDRWSNANKFSTNMTAVAIDGTGAVTAAVVGGPQSNIGGFGDIETEQRGDVVEIPVEGVPIGGYVTVTFGEQEDGYVSNVTVRDDDNDGTVVLEWNSYLADGSQEVGEDSPWGTTGGDTVINQNVVSGISDGPSHIISAGTYSVSAREGRISDDATEQPPDALGSVTLEPRSTEQVRTWTAPQRLSGDLTSVSDLEARAGDELTLTSDIVKGDLLVTSVHTSGIEGLLRAQDEDTPTAKFYQALTTGAITHNHTHLQSGATNKESDTVTDNFVQTNGNLRVIPDYDNDVYYIIHETANEDRFVTRRSFRTQFTVEGLARNQANFGLVAPNANGEFRDEVITSEFDFAPASVSLSTTPDGTVEVRSAGGQTIGGTSTYAPGTQFRVRIQSKTGSESQFIIGPKEVTVQPDGRWSLPADFSSYAAGSTFTVEVSDDSGVLTRADGRIRSEPEVRTFQFTDQESRGSVATVSEVELSAGGFVVIREGSENGRILGVSNYVDGNELTQELLVVLDERLERSTTLVAMPYLDSNNDQEFEASTDSPYTAGGSPISDSARLSLAGGSPDFTVSNLQPADVTIGADTNLPTVSATVSNEGSDSGTQTVAWRVDGSTVTSREVELGPGESQTVTFRDLETQALPAGSYTHGIVTADDSQTATLTIESEPEPSTVEVSSVDPGDVAVNAGESVDVTATLSNTGQAEFTQSVDLLVDDTLLDRVSVSFDRGSTRTVEFDAILTEELEPGEHTYTISTGDDRQSSSLTVSSSSGPSDQVESLSFGSQSPGTDAATLESVRLSEGGFIAIHKGSASGPVIGVSDFLAGGQSHEDITVSYSDSVSEGSDVVAVAHYDTNNNLAFDYESSGGSEDGPYATSSDQIASQTVGGSASSDPDSNSDSGVSASGSGLIEEFGVAPLAGFGVLGLGLVGYSLYRFRSDDKPAPTEGAEPAQTQSEPQQGQAQSEPAQTGQPEETAQPPESANTGPQAGGENAGADESDTGTEAAGTASEGGQSGDSQDVDGADGEDSTAASSSGSEPTSAESAGGAQSQPDLEREVPALTDLTLRDSGIALATYAATLTDRDGDVPVEVITLSPDIETDDALISEFERAVGQWFNASTHPNVRTVHDRGTDPRPWIAVEDLSDVATLGDIHNELSLEDTVEVLSDAAEAVRNVGLYNGTHHNLSLDCIKLLPDQDGYTAVVDDWGLDRIVQEHVDGEYVTPYTAPEQLDGGAADEQTDVYGLGAVSYHAVTGQEPLPADATAIQEGDIADANEFVQIPPQTDSAIMTALSTDPTNRHRSVYDFGQSLSSSLH